MSSGRGGGVIPIDVGCRCGARFPSAAGARVHCPGCRRPPEAPSRGLPELLEAGDLTATWIKAAVRWLAAATLAAAVAGCGETPATAYRAIGAAAERGDWGAVYDRIDTR